MQNVVFKEQNNELRQCNASYIHKKSSEHIYDKNIEKIQKE